MANAAAGASRSRLEPSARTLRGVLWVVLLVVVHLLVCTPALSAELEMGDLAVQEITYLSTNLAGRRVGTHQEKKAIAYLVHRLESFGYLPRLQPFSFEQEGILYTTFNIIAERQGISGQQMIVGAHYDTAPSSVTRDRTRLQGTSDNASGVGVLLELAMRLEAATTHTVKFILFGAEEVGLQGSSYYAENMTEAEIDSTLVMVNLDNLIVGDQMYLNAGRGAAITPDWGRYRDLALSIAADSGIVAATNPGLSPGHPQGTGCCSDLEAFDLFMPVLAAEATNWGMGDLDGYTQTSHPNVAGGSIWHDPDRDNLTFINTVFPGLIEQRSRHFTLILDKFIDRLNGMEYP